jgi:hypothetical protein
MITVDTAHRRAGIGSAIGYHCNRGEPAMYARVIAAPNANVEGDAFQPWQFHERGYA